MLKISSIKSLPSDEGEWQNVPDWPGVRLMVRSINVRDYQVARELLVQKLVKALGRMPTSPEMEPQLGKLVARHLLRGWEGIAGEGDKPLDFSPEKALEMCTDPELREFETQVLWAASRVGEREAEFTIDALKN